MLYLKATNTDEKIEYFNTQNILTIQPWNGGENLKILMGACMSWIVKADSVEFVELENIFNNKTT